MLGFASNLVKPAKLCKKMSKNLYKIKRVLERRAFGQVRERLGGRAKAPPRPADANEARTEPYNNTAREDLSLQQRNWPNLKGPYCQAEAGRGRASYNKGFTLVEALVALVILTIALGPSLILSSDITNVASVIQNDLIAANLAQEGVEVVRALRDSNWFTSLPFNTGFAGGIFRVEGYSASMIVLGANPPLKVNNGLYNYSAGTDTIFQRTITINNVNLNEIRIVSDVIWTERGSRARDVKVESHLFNWK